MFQIEKIGAIRDRVKSNLTDKIGDITKGSLIDTLAEVLVGELYLLNRYLAYQNSQLYIDTADTVNLDAIGRSLGRERKEATKTEYNVNIDNNLDDDIEVETGDTLTAEANGAIFVFESSFTIGSGDTVTKKIVSQEVGTHSLVNQTSETFSNPFGLDSEQIEVDALVSGGTDRETDIVYAQRLKSEHSNIYGIGSSIDVINTIKKLEDIDQAFIIPNYTRVGRMGIWVSVMSGSTYDNDLENTITDEILEKYVYFITKDDIVINELEDLDVELKISVSPKNDEIEKTIEDNIKFIAGQIVIGDEDVHISRFNNAIASIQSVHTFRLDTFVVDSDEVDTFNLAPAADDDSDSIPVPKKLNLTVTITEL